MNFCILKKQNQIGTVSITALQSAGSFNLYQGDAKGGGFAFALLRANFSFKSYT
jgi:hypothetical protein